MLGKAWAILDTPVSEQPLHRNVEWFRGRLAFEAPRLKDLLCPATRFKKKKKLVPGKFQIRTSKNVHLRFSWYEFKTEDVYNFFKGPCFEIFTTKILNGPEKNGTSLPHVAHLLDHLVLWCFVLNPHRRSPNPKLLWCDTR